MKLTPEQIQSQLTSFHGTEGYYRYMGGLQLTDGVKWLAETCGCYWFLDVIASYQTDQRVRGEAELRDMQFWILKVDTQKGRGEIILERDTDDQVLTQEIPHTDFPLEEVRVYVCGGVVLLPSEY